MSNPTELPDLDRLEALARAATPGPWMRLWDERTVYDRMNDGCRGNAIVRADMGYSTADSNNLDFIAAANPAAVLALIALARRAQPEGEAEYTVDHRELAGKVLSFAGISSRGSLEPGADQLADRLAEKLAGWGVKFGQPEGEAPQAEPIGQVVMYPNYSTVIRWRDGVTPPAGTLLYDHAPAAQHAESRARSHETIVREGSNLVCTACGTSSPGTPEAPAELPRLYRFDCYVGKTKMAAGVGVHASTMEEAEQKAHKMIDKEETIKFESNQPCHATRKCGICAEYARAAQLDGGQGEGERDA